MTAAAGFAPTKDLLRFIRGKSRVDWLVRASLFGVVSAALLAGGFWVLPGSVLFALATGLLCWQADIYGTCRDRSRYLLRQGVLSAACRQLGTQAYRQRPAQDLLRPFAGSGLLPRWFKLRDHLVGTYRGCRFNMATLLPPGRGEGRPSWSDTLLWFPIDVPAAIRIGFARVPRGLRVSRLQGPRFVATGDPAAVARWLDPAVLQVLTAIDRLYRFGTPRAAIAQGHFLLLLPQTKGLFRFGGLFQPAPLLRRDCRRALFAAALPRRIIDLFGGETPTRLI